MFCGKLAQKQSRKNVSRKKKREKESSEVKVVIASRVECLESVAVGDDEMSCREERSHDELLYSQAITSLPSFSA